ncbi:hypothetical protein Trichorick_00068 [Candidatus Trichorickettsia mobilis]|uniref:Uncharacterized protein n=1 Tax=Candidatus Trichorickettsia mobilis TaxID=1346319 RepID=A0ABZ0URG1_9RICK|nr:hypothetical protein [Candidatus Trichorickettsia mobilis]WPY00196.1 hypothetical protein Trichorick_00068 [Candidatus Trichorickettsia mobilis]
MSKYINYARKGKVAQPRYEGWKDVDYNDRVLDAFARVFEVQETTAVAVARNENNDLLLTYNIPSIFFNSDKDNKELQSTKIRNSLVEEEAEENNNVTSCKERIDEKIECIHNILKDLYKLNLNNKEYSNQFNKKFVEILILKQDYLDLKTKVEINKVLRQQDFESINKLKKQYLEDKDSVDIEEIRINPNLYNKTKLYQDTVKIITYFKQEKYFPEIEICDNSESNFHAENLLSGFVENGLYIGVSTLSCSDCALVLNDKDIKFRGTHGVSYHSYKFQEGTQEHFIEESETKYDKGYKVLKETIILNHDNSDDDLSEESIFEQQAITKLLPINHQHKSKAKLKFEQKLKLNIQFKDESEFEDDILQDKYVIQKKNAQFKQNTASVEKKDEYFLDPSKKKVCKEGDHTQTSQDQYITPIKFNIGSNNSQSASLFSGSTQDTFFSSNSLTQIQISSFELETLGIKLGGT